jgi:hypothetical protein
VAVRPHRSRSVGFFDFELTDEQMTRIAGLDTGASLFFDHRDPPWSRGSTTAPISRVVPVPGARLELALPKRGRGF